MLPKDIFVRSIEHPKDFPSGVLDQEQFFQFSNDDLAPENYVLSVASRWLLRNIEGVHEYGRYVVQCKNERFFDRHGHGPDPMRKYLGSYSVFAESVDEVKLPNYRVDLRWKPENGQDAYFQIELILAGTGGNRTLKKDRREMRRALFDARFGPDICDIALADVAVSEVIADLEVIPKPD